MIQNRFFKATLLTSVIALSGCQSTYLNPEHAEKLKPLSDNEQGVLSPLSNWQHEFNSPQLVTLVTRSLDQNIELKESLARVNAAAQQAVITGAPLRPSIDLNASSQRLKQNDSRINQFSENHSANLSLSWEVDLWGKLSDAAKSGQLQFEAEQAAYQGARLSLAGKVAKAWFDALAQQELEVLFRQRVSNLNNNLEIIQSGYRQGINSALDLYLARSDLAFERSQLIAQENTLTQAIRTLEVLLGQPPAGKKKNILTGKQTLKDIKIDTIAANIPLDIIYQRYDIRSSYLQLKAADRDVAVAHKARYPGFTITAQGGDSSDEFKQLFNQSSLAWSLLGGITQPIFSGGLLKAQQQKRFFELQQKEQSFLQTLQTAYQDLYNTMDTEKSIQQQLIHFSLAKDNAEAAEKLAFEKYTNGLQDYTTVLESQRRAFTSQNNVINAKKELLFNRVNFYLATGTHF